MHRIARLIAATLVFVSIAIIGSSQAASASESATVLLRPVPASVGMVGAQMPETEAPETNDLAQLFIYAGIGMVALGSVIVLRAMRSHPAHDVHAVVVTPTLAFAI